MKPVAPSAFDPAADGLAVPQLEAAFEVELPADEGCHVPPIEGFELLEVRDGPGGA